MNWVDVALTVSVIVAVTNGWRVGIIRGITGLIGLIAGAWLALQLIPAFANVFNPGIGLRIFGGIAVIVTLAMLGQSIGFAFGSMIRATLSWTPIRLTDSLFGSGFRVLSWALVVWLSASVIALLPDSGLSRQVRGSLIVQEIDGLAPTVADQATAALRRVLRNTSFPQVFAGIAPTPVATVAAPDALAVQAPAVVDALDSVVEVLGVARQCEQRMAGTGFFFTGNRIMTNAHVVAGADEIRVRPFGDSAQYRARVVLFDPELDVAVLVVRGVRGTPLSFDPEAAIGEDAVVPGFTGGDPMSPDAARIADRLIARGHDIYGAGRVDREIYVLRSQVAPGDSGAPLLNLRGQVIGVIFAAGTDSDDVGYALTATAVSEAARTGERAIETVGTGVCDA